MYPQPDRPGSIRGGRRGEASSGFINEEPYVTVSHKTVMNPPETVWGAMQPMDEVWLDRRGRSHPAGHRKGMA